MADDRLTAWQPDRMTVEVLSTNPAEPWVPITPWCVGVVYVATFAIRRAACSSKAAHDGNR